MILLQRVTPIIASLIAIAVFGVVWLVPTSLYAATAVALLLYWWIAAALPATGVGEKLQRWLILSLPLVSGGWLWLLLDQPSIRQWLPIVTVLIVLTSGEVLFQTAYRRVYNPRAWMIIITVLSAWFLCTALALSNLLLNWSTILIALVGGAIAVALLHHLVYVYALPIDPWWAQLAWLIIYSQIFYAILLLPVTYTSQAIAGLVILMIGFRLRLGQRVSSLSFNSTRV